MGDLQAMMARLFAMTDARVLGDLEGAADFLRAREDVTGKVGCIGFCMGGRYTLLFAVLQGQPRRGGGLLGRLHRRARRSRSAPPPSAQRRRSQLVGPSALPAVRGGRRRGPEPLARARRAACASALAQRPGERRDVYEGAGHAFFADYRPSYRPEPAAKLWSGSCRSCTSTSGSSRGGRRSPASHAT